MFIYIVPSVAVFLFLFLAYKLHHHPEQYQQHAYGAHHQVDQPPEKKNFFLTKLNTEVMKYIQQSVIKSLSSKTSITILLFKTYQYIENIETKITKQNLLTKINLVSISSNKTLHKIIE